MATDTDTLPTAVLRLAQRTRLAAQMTLVADADGTLNDAIRLLITAARADVQTLADAPDTSDAAPSKADYVYALGRASTILEVLAVALSRFDDHTRCAPPAALAELMSESAEPCANERCDRSHMQWEANVCPECEAPFLRSVGEAS